MRYEHTIPGLGAGEGQELARFLVALWIIALQGAASGRTLTGLRERTTGSRAGHREGCLEGCLDSLQSCVDHCSTTGRVYNDVIPNEGNRGRLMGARSHFLVPDILYKA